MVRLKLSQLPAFVPAHLGESSTSGLAGMIAPVQAKVGLLSETVPPAGVALLEVDTNETATIAMATQHTVSTVNLNLVVILDDCDFGRFVNIVFIPLLAIHLRPDRAERPSRIRR